MSWTFCKYFKRVGKMEVTLNGAPCEIIVDFDEKVLEVHADTLFFEDVRNSSKSTLRIDEDYEYDDEM